MSYLIFVLPFVFTKYDYSESIQHPESLSAKVSHVTKSKLAELFLFPSTSKKSLVLVQPIKSRAFKVKSASAKSIPSHPRTQNLCVFAIRRATRANKRIKALGHEDEARSSAIALTTAMLLSE